MNDQGQHAVPGPQAGQPLPDGPVPFFSRYPSATWEWLPLDGSGVNHAWVWFRPANMPNGLLLRVSEETYAHCRGTGQLTMRMLLRATGVDVASVSMWSLYGVPNPGHAGINPMLDQVISEPPAGSDATIAVDVAVLAVSTVPQPGPLVTGPAVVNVEVYEVIAAHWNACRGLESRLDSLRKQLTDMMSRLKTLNRELTFDEKAHADRQDRDDWEDARRWLRGAVTQLSRCLKACDVGDTKFAGKKEWLQQIHDEYIVTRQPLGDIQSVERDFEYHRRQLLTLESQISGAIASAGQDGARRAQQVLSRLATKVSQGRSERR